MSESTDQGRGRVWATIVYPESCPENWIQILDDLHIPACISPVHDKDIDDAEMCDNGGEIVYKKAHWHVLLLFDGMKSNAQVIKICNQFGAIRPKQMDNIRATARYWCHMDHPWKAQYLPKDVVCLGGVNYDELTHSVSDYQLEIQNMRQYVRDNNILYMADFVDYCDFNREDWAYLLNTRYYQLMNAYIKSYAYRMRNEPESPDK